ncbi:hypothetical protein GGI25_000775 [Coemansia spiralis]|uniref:FAD-binding FR-type domain-containing protein n=2 Tax=Coemansia TaxID=4863 RepID=A0A9W8GC28_9FUNG|nr:ferric reductase NAD binding domain-containing protein [Coemansia spiralis]KAJ1987399.1 hypothetical protein EDC05_005857 [Coemansia umbellata]KAJ2621935.1 hypothetical protein GGI26_003639 [Coemansia sp. RSA 1358]KAJ2680483.1 hypothetical protein GGI25_000775 [Coemansia spiralis]
MAGPHKYTAYQAADLKTAATTIAQNQAFSAHNTPEHKHKSWLPLITPRRVVVLSLWFVPQLIFLITMLIKGSNAGDTLNGLTGAVQSLLMFNLSCTFLFMTPSVIGVLRQTFLRRHVDFDKNVHAHKLCAYSMVFWSIIHVIARYYRYYTDQKTSHGTISMTTLLFKHSTGRIGHILIGTVIAILLAATPYVRRKHFELFYLLHHMHYLLIIFIFLHVPKRTFQYYISGPLAVYLLDRIFRTIRGYTNRPRILSVIQHPSDVIELRFQKRGMKSKVGQYIYLNVPSISWFQWHPFTLTSAPEENELSVHIRVSGNWTHKLVQTFKKHESSHARKLNIVHQSISFPPPAKHKILADDRDSVKTLTVPSIQDIRDLKQPQQPASRSNNNSDHRPTLPPYYPPELDYYAFARSNTNSPAFNINKRLPAAPIHSGSLPTIFVDGPYSAPTQHVFDFDISIMIAGNIGVTPMSSVLKSLYYQVTAMRKSPRKIKKLYFIWVCRETQSFEWFKDLLAALDEENTGEILEMRTYLTGQLSMDQIRNIALSQDTDGPDAVTGLYRSPTYYGRPNFDKIFEEIGMRNPLSDIGVFFCGSNGLAHDLRRTNRKWSNNLVHRKTRFVFHEEKTG